nr:MAG: replication associated protein [Arizlama virus]
MSSEKLSHDEPAGNTVAAGKTKVSPCQLYRWCMTLKAKVDEEGHVSQESQMSQVYELWDVLHEISKEFIFQLEKGEGGYLHFQGTFTLKTKHRMNEVKNLLGDSTVHLEGTKNWFASKKYCSKPEGRVVGPYSNLVRPLEPKIKGDLLPWQKELVAFIDRKPDDRTIRVYYDPVGRTGKSSIGIHLSRIRKDVLYIPSGRYDGVKECVIRAVATGRIRAVIFGLPRQLTHTIPWGLMEELKDGCALNTRYEGLLAHFDPVHVIVMTNWLPDVEHRGNLLTEDRWDVVNLN